MLWQEAIMSGNELLANYYLLSGAIQAILLLLAECRAPSICFTEATRLLLETFPEQFSKKVPFPRLGCVVMDHGVSPQDFSGHQQEFRSNNGPMSKLIEFRPHGKTDQNLAKNYNQGSLVHIAMQCIGQDDLAYNAYLKYP